MSLVNEQSNNGNDEHDDKMDLNKQLDTVLKLINSTKNLEFNFSKFDTSQTSSYYAFRHKFSKLYGKKSRFRVFCSYWDIILLGSLNLVFFFCFLYYLAAYYDQLPRIDFPLIKSKGIQLLAQSWMKWNGLEDMRREECSIPMPDLLFPTVRPVDDCSMCLNVKEIKRVSKISKQEFLNKYAYTGIPVIITDATQDWSAMNVVNYTFLKQLYLGLDDLAYRKRQSRVDIHADGKQSAILNTFNSIVETDKQRAEEFSGKKDACQFFTYKTNFTGLDDLFEMEMNDARWNEPWYVGWSNCNNNAADELRKHYSRPYFLPDDSEISRIDWIFIGFATGANIHIDNVDNPSWQAQISGVKQWTFVPPAECFFKCSILYADIHPGEVFIFDSNRWFHSTTVKGDTISLTIGSEYD